MKVLLLKIDFHVHTCFSKDCKTSLDDLILYSRRNGLNGVAITDHNCVQGTLRLNDQKRDDLLVIPGVEVSTNRGHLLGLNITRAIPQRTSIEETIQNIHEAGGIAVAPHPSAFYKKGVGLDPEIAFSGLDAIEVINSANLPFHVLNWLNMRYANRTDLPAIAGSDSHLPETIGMSYTLVHCCESKPSVDGVLKAINKGKTLPFGRPIPWKLRIKKITDKKINSYLNYNWYKPKSMFSGFIESQLGSI